MKEARQMPVLEKNIRQKTVCLKALGTCLFSDVKTPESNLRTFPWQLCSVWSSWHQSLLNSGFLWESVDEPYYCTSDIKFQKWKFPIKKKKQERKYSKAWQQSVELMGPWWSSRPIQLKECLWVGKSRLLRKWKASLLLLSLLFETFLKWQVGKV